MNTRSNLDLHAIPISELQYTSSRQQTTDTLVQSTNSITTMATVHSTVKSDDDHEKTDVEALCEYKKQHLNAIKILTAEEMLNIDQWLLTLCNTYEELHCPTLFRVYNATQYFLEEEQAWFKQEKNTINKDWSCFCEKLKQHVYNRLKSYADNSSKDHSIESSNAKKQLEQFTCATYSSSDDNNSSFTSQLPVTMARELIRTPTYFRGSKDDVLDWLEKLEQRFKMATWDDETKLRYISIHLQDDAYRW
ncbi:unnamed protein product [Rotaria sp. Silwood2]|nr:unnamed protein product [Rotaria sp. Silwood2]CAF3018191.1 unnamed protein product [Rotaria sp. Silwood2]CAF3327578.1 unnamed protein product [Rotaria sp. Silwood2]CAF3356001.1 unnamed protein product [Rotaria sp. Silwood2]CAF4153055.1 unnamed protein product [Rotaria sp. Silwood2]